MTSLAILGGGPAGLGVAYYAHRAGMRFALVEASSELGGMCRTLRWGEHLYDCGAHRLHDRDPEITQDIVELMGASLHRVHAPSAVRDRGRFVDFPPRPFNAMFAYGWKDAGRIGLDLARSVGRRRRSFTNFEDLAVARFGETLARRILLNYSAKLWGLPPDRLSPDVATRRLRGLTLRSLMHELVSRRRATEHLDGSFLYPRKGYGEIVEALASQLPSASILTRSEVVGLDVEGGGVRRVHCADGRILEGYDRVVSTLPLTRLVKLLGVAMPEDAHAAADRLRFRQVRLFVLRLNIPRLSDYASIYVPDPAFCISRISEPKSRSIEMSPAEETVAVVEVPCFPGDETDRRAEADLAFQVVEELSRLGLLNPDSVLEWRHHRIPNAYPVYSVGYAEDVRVIETALSSISNLDTLGRAGRFTYSHLHDQMRFGKDHVEKLVASQRPSSKPSRPDAAVLLPEKIAGPSAELNAKPLPLARLRQLANRLMDEAGRWRSDPADDAWVRSVLAPEELALWARLPAYDRRHAVRVARRLQRRLSLTDYRDDGLWLSVALMHDIGKLASELSWRGRMLAIVLGKTIRVGTARRWARSGDGVRRRIGSYLIHGEIGARMVRNAGGREEVAQWSEVHQGYREIERLAIPPAVVTALIESDAV